MQLEAAWILKYITSDRDQREKVADCDGAIPLFIELLRSKSTSVAEQCAWALEKIVTSKERIRDEVFEHGAAEALMEIIEKNQQSRVI